MFSITDNERLRDAYNLIFRSQTFSRGFLCPDADFPVLRFTGLANAAFRRCGQASGRQDNVRAVCCGHTCGSDVVPQGIFLPRFIFHPAVRANCDRYSGNLIDLCVVHLIHRFQRCCGQLTCQTRRILLGFLRQKFKVGFECDSTHSRLSSLKSRRGRPMVAPPCVLLW